MIKDINSVIILGGGTAGLIAALSLREKFPTIDISIIKSSEIGIVGVGEGSTEHWLSWIQYVGLSVPEIIKNTGATVKIGIYFKDWNGQGHRYVHTVDEFSHVSPLNRHDYYNMLVLEDKSLSPNFERQFLNNTLPLTNNLNASNQFHFDTFKLNAFLSSTCEARDIKIIDGIVADVTQDQEGYIESLIMNDGAVHAADFFIDCSGFKKIISGKMGNKWNSFKDYLPMNKAIAFPTEHDSDNYESYTTSTALSSGWSWKIPTQERYGNGYVYCDAYTDSDNALAEMNSHLGKSVEKVARDIKFEAGRIEKFWNKNCLSLGLAGSFAEPLEAQSIGFTILQVNGLLEHIEGWTFNNNAVEKLYNDKFNYSFDNIVSYLQIHYFTKREDTAFWKDKPFKLTSFNQDTKEAFEAGNITQSFFQHPYLMFSSANWYQVYAGLGLVDKEKVQDIMNSCRAAYVDKIKSDMRQLAENSNAVTPYTINHSEALNLIKGTL